MKLGLLLISIALLSAKVSAEQLEWGLPFGVGTVQLPLQSKELVGGYDALLKDSIVGFSTPVATLFKEIVVQVGAVGALPLDGSESSGPKIEPYLGGGLDIKKHVPALDRFTSLHINAFGRYSTERGKPGAGVAMSYSF